MIDRQTPVIVGVGQVNGAPGAEEPLDLIAQAVEEAIQDSGTKTIPIDLIALTKIGTKQYANAPRRLGERTGFPNARTLQANHGGHTSQITLNHIASEIAFGSTQAAILAGGELGTGLKKGLHVSDTGTPTQPDSGATDDVPPDLGLGDDLYQWICHPHEDAIGINEPIQLYPLMETSLGAALGRTREEHLAEISRLWSRFSEVAAQNEFANDRQSYTPQQIATAGPGNRYVGYPYTKLMNSNQFIDQAAAILLCSAGIAMDLGISRDRWVYPWAGVTAHCPVVSERHSLHDSPALAIAGRLLSQMIGRSLNEIELVDLYACFPFAVQTQANALGLDPANDLTLTGGMRFAGGPWNNYGTHMIANLVHRSREQPDEMALCSTNGGLATRFNLTAYSGTPRPDGFRALPSPIIDPGPRRPLETRPQGSGKIEAYTVLHDRANEPVSAVAACLLPNGARAWAKLSGPETLGEMLAADPIGRSVQFTNEGDRLS